MDITDYKSIKNKLFIKVCNASGNQEFLKNVPHKEISDLALTYHILLSDSETETTTVQVSSDILERFNVSQDQLHEDAIKSGEFIYPPILCDVAECVLGVNEKHNFLDPGVVATLSLPTTFCLTNASNLNGAAAMFYPNVLDRISICAKGSYFILPTSVHELIILPEFLKPSLIQVQETIYMANTSADFLEDGDTLSFNVYHYDNTTKIFESIKF